VRIIDEFEDVLDYSDVSETLEICDTEELGDLETSVIPMEDEIDLDIEKTEEYDNDNRLNDAEGKYYQESINNPDSSIVLLGKYDAVNPENSYEVQAEANEYKFFSNPNYSEFAEKNGLSDDEMYEKFNKEFLDEEVAGKNCEVQTSHNAESSGGAFGREANYLAYEHDYEYCEDTGIFYPPGEMPEEGSELPEDAGQ